MGIYAIPALVRSITESKQMNSNIKFDTKITGLFLLLKQNLGSVFRGNWIGFLSGLIPYVGVDMSSYIAYYTERYLKKSTLAQVAAAETACNAAGISVLLPLLIYGIAIQPSEVLVLELTNTVSFALNWTTVQPVFHILAFWLIVGNLVSFLFSWNFAGWLINKITLMGSWLPWILLTLCVYSLYTIGTSYGQGIYYIAVLAAFSLIGYLVRFRDMLPFVFVLMLQDKLEPALIRLFVIYGN
jgi:TctA family transporter